MTVEAGSIYQSSESGNFEVIEYINYSNVKVRFLSTGFIKTASKRQVLNGNIKDPMHKRVYGIGFIGIGNQNRSSKGISNQIYNSWYGMLTRCYSKKYLIKKPTYIGCSVCGEWHNFQVFANWFNENYPKDGGRYELDKDIKVDGNKIYSPLTCMFVTQQENTEKARAKNYIFTSPLGDDVIIYNLRKFCKENDLSDSKMCSVHNGKRPSHKGWTKG